MRFRNRTILIAPNPWHNAIAHHKQYKPARASVASVQDPRSLSTRRHLEKFEFNTSAGDQ